MADGLEVRESPHHDAGCALTRHLQQSLRAPVKRGVPGAVV